MAITYRCNSESCNTQWDVPNEYFTNTCPICYTPHGIELVACEYCGKLNPVDEPCEEYETDDGEDILCGDPDAIKAERAKYLHILIRQSRAISYIKNIVQAVA